jgi:uncharacterized protein YutE (UPF0331/DUF86 family)
MPRLPPADNETYAANTKAQYEALGRFVEAFESMVNETRETSVDILTRDAIKDRHLLEVAFHHSALTAQPLFEIMRALIADFIKDPEFQISIKDRDNFAGVLAEIAQEHSALTSERNKLLHGTWFVGYVSPDDPNAENFYINKYKPTKTGLAKQAVPKRAEELLKLRDRCEAVRNWLALLNSCLPLDPEADCSPIGETFEFKDGRWRLYSRR